MVVSFDRQVSLPGAMRYDAYHRCETFCGGARLFGVRVNWASDSLLTLGLVSKCFR